MRAGLAILAILALAAQPAFAQGKSKASPASAALAALEMCETFARGGELVVDEAIDAGWDAYVQDAESPFVKTYGASRDLEGLGWADLFSLFETYPSRTFGYCRIDVYEPRGNGAAVIDAIAGLERYEGDVLNQDDGHFASLSGGDSLLLAHWTEESFVIQLTTLTPTDGE